MIEIYRLIIVATVLLVGGVWGLVATRNVAGMPGVWTGVGCLIAIVGACVCWALSIVRTATL